MIDIRTVAQPAFPFSAVVGQETLKRALILNTLDPTIGGVLVTGPRGTAKTTTTRALASLLPDISIIPGDAFNSAPQEHSSQEFVRVPTPFLSMPLQPSISLLLGNLDVKKILQTGERHFEPGLLARANRGVLYIDNLNRFDETLIEPLLDAVASGTNRIEREGAVFEHQARVILIGVMNPDAGELNPQLLDRFGLYVITDDLFSVSERMDIVQRRMSYEKNPRLFAQQWRVEEQELTQRIIKARTLLPQVQLQKPQQARIAELCANAHINGLRADLTICKTACAIAAFEQRTQVQQSHIDEAVGLALAHRRRISMTLDNPLNDEENGGQK